MYAHHFAGDLFLILIGVIEAGAGAWHVLLAIERGKINQSRYGVRWLWRKKEPQRFRRRLWVDGLLYAGISGFFFVYAGLDVVHKLSAG